MSKKHHEFHTTKLIERFLSETQNISFFSSWVCIFVCIQMYKKQFQQERIQHCVWTTFAEFCYLNVKSTVDHGISSICIVFFWYAAPRTSANFKFECLLDLIFCTTKAKPVCTEFWTSRFFSVHHMIQANKKQTRSNNSMLLSFFS